ncbi:E3 ubiquitin-protein ligase AMFR [Schistosoma japonicum]|uniref:E3 ubiquitin-protein ligase AMFR n=1 Tax=Schistosoma japonicum TaxID=6182 RepID=A0A4Z2CRJ3_SCHJA|nr:E3 ubiquitin-protein ligase [Schistosoma japonicum]TNN06863.1 E3 ubiquitin-protein ligase AMFR [Schistosoma japonicum]
MQVWNLERIPLPNFSTYVVYTTASLVGSIFHVWLQIKNDVKQYGLKNSTSLYYPTLSLTHFLEDSWCFWSLINFGYCLLMCAARELQNLFFGQLRSAEDSHIRENFSSFIFYKVVFIYGILHVEALHELLLWATWFTILGFLRLLTGLIRDRSQYTLRCSDFPLTYQARIFLLCCILLLLSNVLMIISIIVGAKHSLHAMFFMLAEVFQLLIVSVHVITWYLVYLYCEAVSRSNVDDKVYNRFVFLYYTELVFDTFADFGDVLHNLHMLFWNKLQINMSSIIIALHLQHLYYKVSRRYTHHTRYKTLIKVLDSRVVYSEENCSICWEQMNKSCQLPCGHIFHTACLYLWIEQNTNCPICRKCFDNLSDLSPTTSGINLSTASHSSFSTSISTETLRDSSGVSSFHLLSPPINQIDLRTGNELYEGKSYETSVPTTKVSGFPERQVMTDSSLSTHEFIPSEESHFSAMVSMNRLLDVHEELIAEDVANVRTPPKNRLSTKFLAVLESELLRHFRLPDNLNHLELSICKRQVGLLTEHIINSSDQECSSLITDRSPAISSTSNASFLTLYSSHSSSDSSYTDDEDHEFPPKRALRLAIRRLLQRVSQSLLMSGKMCQCHALNICSHKSSIYDRHKSSSIQSASLDNIICQASITSSSFPSYSSTISPSLSFKKSNKHQETSTLTCRDTMCSIDILPFGDHSSSVLDSHIHCPLGEQQSPVESESRKRSLSSEVHHFNRDINEQREKCFMSRREHFRRPAKRAYIKKTNQK